MECRDFTLPDGRVDARGTTHQIIQIEDAVYGMARLPCTSRTGRRELAVTVEFKSQTGLWMRHARVTAEINPQVLIRRALTAVLPLMPIVMAITNPGLARSQSIETSTSFSYCVEPTTVKVGVANDAEKANHKECLRWSEFVQSTSRLSGRSAFVMNNCGTAARRPVNAFAMDLINQVRTEAKLPALLKAPTARDLARNPTAFGMREVRDGESRIGSVFVWAGQSDGMVGSVYDDRNVAGEPLHLDKIFIHYPGGASQPATCGEIRDADVATVVASMASYGVGIPAAKFLKLGVPPIYWNYWVEEIVGGKVVEQPDHLDSGGTYRLRLSLSSLDFSSWQPGSASTPRMPKEQADSAIPPLDAVRYNVYVLAAPPIATAGPDGDRSGARTFSVHPQASRLRDSLANAPDTGEVTRGALAYRHDATGESGGLMLGFTLDADVDCAAFTILVTDQNDLPLSAWSQNLRGSAASDADCAVQTSSSRRIDLLSLFDTAVDAREAAQLAFMEFPGKQPRTIGVFVEPGMTPYVWVLNTASLKTRLLDMAHQIEPVIAEPGFDLSRWSTQLRDELLFPCAGLPDDQCGGIKARARLLDMAKPAAGGGRRRLQVSFRDAQNSRFYLPASIMATTDGVLLGQQLDIVQPLPRPVSHRSESHACVSHWTAGLVLTDADEGTDWRRTWWKGLGAESPDPFKLSSLKGYFASLDVSSSPDGLVLLAHHGATGISDEPMGGEFVTSDDIRRTFGHDSVAVLAMCSVGAMSDSDARSSAILDKLNAANVTAVVSTPFALPLSVAKGFLTQLKVHLLSDGNGKTLRENFNLARESMRASTSGSDSLISVKQGMETLMLLGDGDVRLCNAPLGKEAQ